MHAKRAPFILLIILCLVLMFVMGVRYGQRVEQTNKQTVAMLSLTPVKKPSSTQVPLSFKTYENKRCGVSFVYPVGLVLKDATRSAKFIRDKTTAISFTCETALPKTATPPGYLQKKVTNTRIGRITLFTFSKDLSSLFENTLKTE